MNSLLLAFVLGVSSTSPYYGISTTNTPIIQNVRIGNSAIVALNTGTTPPAVLSYTPPAYTDEARQLGIEGAVTIRAQFDINGAFQVLGVVNGLGYGLDETALAAVQDWRFRPAYRSGARVGVVANIDVSFSLLGVLNVAPIIDADGRIHMRISGGVSGIGGSFLGIQYSPDARNHKQQ